MSQKKREPCFVIDLNRANKNDKLKISPIGEVEGIDGRLYTINGEDVVTKTKTRNIDIVMNVNHGWDEYKEKAAGWFDLNSLEVKEDGIYASLETTNIGEELISEKHYRYLSPEYRVAYDGNNRIVTELVGVGLVNRPNLLDEALNNEESTKTEPIKEGKDMALDPNKKQPIDAQLKKLQEENAQLKLNEKKSKIDMAIAKGELMPNKQEYALKLDGEMLDEFLALNREDMKHLSTHTTPDTDEGKNRLSDIDKEVNAQLGIDEKEK